MDTVRLMDTGVVAAAEKAASVLNAGGVVLYPTDTLYGLAVDAFSDEAVAKVYALKGREQGKPIHCIVADIAMAERYGEFDTCARTLAEKFLPGPLTIVVKKRAGLDTGIARGINTIGFRIPKNEFCLALARAFGKPFTTTSANVSGAQTPLSIENIVEQFGEAASRIDLALDAGVLPDSAPSTVVGVNDGEAVILREGAISAQDILSVINAGPPDGRRIS